MTDNTGNYPSRCRDIGKIRCQRCCGVSGITKFSFIDRFIPLTDNKDDNGCR